MFISDFGEVPQSAVFLVCLGLFRGMCLCFGLCVLVFLFFGLSREICSFQMLERFRNLWYFCFVLDCVEEYAYGLVYVFWYFCFFGLSRVVCSFLGLEALAFFGSVLMTLLV